MIDKIVNTLKEWRAQDRQKMDEMLKDEGLTWAYHRRRCVLIKVAALGMS